MYFQLTGYNVEIFYWKTKPLNAFIHFQGGLWNLCLKSILKCFLIYQWNPICFGSNYFIFHYDYTLGLTLKFQLNLLVLVFSWPFSCKSAIGVIFSVADPGCLFRIRIFPSRIPDPRSKRSGSASKYSSIFYPKNCFQALRNMIRGVHSESGSWFFTHPRSRIQGTGSGSATLVIFIKKISSTVGNWSVEIPLVK
jgi:hypothetical protein